MVYYSNRSLIVCCGTTLMWQLQSSCIAEYILHTVHLYACNAQFSSSICKMKNSSKQSSVQFISPSIRLHRCSVIPGEGQFGRKCDIYLSSWFQAVIRLDCIWQVWSCVLPDCIHHHIFCRLNTCPDAAFLPSHWLLESRRFRLVSGASSVICFGCCVSGWPVMDTLSSHQTVIF